MTSESSTTASNLSVAVTTDEVTHRSGEVGSKDNELIFRGVVLVLGVLGTAANGMVLYALVASKQHKKHILIFNQNALDLFSSIFCRCNIWPILVVPQYSMMFSTTWYWSPACTVIYRSAIVYHHGIGILYYYSEIP